jgi:hypothetical protein
VIPCSRLGSGFSFSLSSVCCALLWGSWLVLWHLYVVLLCRDDLPIWVDDPVIGGAYLLPCLIGSTSSARSSPNRGAWHNLSRVIIKLSESDSGSSPRRTRAQCADTARGRCEARTHRLHGGTC